jgi:two-component system NtrC family sensor kinase
MRRAGEIVKSLHAFSRSGATDAFQAVDLHAMLDRTLTLIRHRIGRSVVVQRCYGDIPPVQCLPSQLDQVFLNLLLNAADAVGAAGTVTISTRGFADPADGRARVAVSVHDSGAGVPGDSLPHIFEPFFTTKPIGRGTGLGLSIVYGAVKTHGGTVSVDSEVGQGTTITVRLPLAATG